MTLGPIEILVLGFPGNEFNGRIIPELERVVADGTITIIDGLYVRTDADGHATYFEVSELGAKDDAAALSRLMDRVDGLISDDDVVQLTAVLESNSSAAILVFEHSWVIPLRDAVVASGGVMLETIRIPGAAVDEVFDAVRAMD